MRKYTKKNRKVKAIEQKQVQSKVINEEAMLAMSMRHFAARVLDDAVARIKNEIVGAHSWGTEDSFVRAGLVKIPVKKKRLRANGKELPIEEFDRLQEAGEFNQSVKCAILGGLATRSFEDVGEALGSAKGLSKSTVSRVSKSFAEDFEKMMNQDCSDIKAVLVDGIYYSDDLCLVAVMGIGQFGGKRVLGLWAGSTETAELMQSVMSDLKQRNLNPKLFVIDGSKALRKAIRKHFGDIPVQRCQVHKQRNILGHVGKKNEAWARTKMAAIFKAEDDVEALRLGLAFLKELEEINITAARSWREAFPETITVCQIKDPLLKRTLATTNAIESFFSSVRIVTGRVKRWRNANQALYWTAGAYSKVQPNFRKVRGYRALIELDNIEPIDQEAALKKVS